MIRQFFTLANFFTQFNLFTQFNFVNLINLLAILNLIGCNETASQNQTNSLEMSSSSATSSISSSSTSNEPHKDSFTSIAKALKLAGQQDMQQGGSQEDAPAAASDQALAQSVAEADTKMLAANLADTNMGGAIANAYAASVATLDGRPTDTTTEDPSTIPQKSSSEISGANIAAYFGLSLFGVAAATLLVQWAVNKPKIASPVPAIVSVVSLETEAVAATQAVEGNTRSLGETRVNIDSVTEKVSGLNAKLAEAKASFELKKAELEAAVTKLKEDLSAAGIEPKGNMSIANQLSQEIVEKYSPLQKVAFEKLPQSIQEEIKGRQLSFQNITVQHSLSMETTFEVLYYGSGGKTVLTATIEDNDETLKRLFAEWSALEPKYKSLDSSVKEVDRLFALSTNTRPVSNLDGIDKRVERFASPEITRLEAEIKTAEVEKLVLEAKQTSLTGSLKSATSRLEDVNARQAVAIETARSLGSPSIISDSNLRTSDGALGNHTPQPSSLDDISTVGDSSAKEYSGKPAERVKALETGSKFSGNKVRMAGIAAMGIGAIVAIAGGAASGAFGLVDSTVVDATQVNATQVDATQVDATQVNATQVDATQVNATQSNATQEKETPFAKALRLVLLRTVVCHWNAAADKPCDP